MNAPPVMSYHSRRHISTDISEERNLPVYPTIERSEGKILRPRYKDLLQDPASMLYLIQHPPTPLGLSSKQLDEHNVRLGRIAKFKKVLQATDVNLGELRDLAWSGIPGELRAFSWQLLLGYLPTLSAQRVPSMEGKRREYLESMKAAFKTTDPAPNGSTGRPLDPDRGRDLDEAVWHQIEIDIPRTNPHLPLYQYEATQRSLERVLYTWAVRHPASGYVQGMNDLITPFWQVFLGTYITDSDIESGMDPGQLPKSVLDAVEADTYWCLTKLLDGIQDNYIYAQPGIQRQVAALRDLTARIDLGLARHLEREGVEFIQFSFRWINCLLMREVSIDNVIRMWDTYLVSPLPRATITNSFFLPYS